MPVKDFVPQKAELFNKESGRPFGHPQKRSSFMCGVKQL
jgi:hypothetical protein